MTTALIKAMLLLTFEYKSLKNLHNLLFFWCFFFPCYVYQLMLCLFLTYTFLEKKSYSWGPRKIWNYYALIYNMRKNWETIIFTYLLIYEYLYQFTTFSNITPSVTWDLGIFFFFRAALIAYGATQARGWIGAVAVSLHQPTPQP